ncbi:MAG TPA: HNH endonuclease [Blastocatellia bacterium]|nr:HNH endonuclease [Blastocatellia bacterium]
MKERYYICHICHKKITSKADLNFHHTRYKSEGGDDSKAGLEANLQPAHRDCHIRLHRERGDFAEWGKRSAETRAYAFHLKGVKTSKHYDFDRAYYLAFWAR